MVDVQHPEVWVIIDRPVPKQGTGRGRLSVIRRPVKTPV